MNDPEQRLAKLQKQFHGLRIVGGEGVIVHGSPARGYAVEIRSGPTDSSAGGGPGPTPTGACCMMDNSCNVLTSDDCATMGGAYQGDGTTCSPNPCTCTPITSFVVSGMTDCCMNSLGLGYNILGGFDGDYGPLDCTGPSMWGFTGLTTGFQWANPDCSGATTSFNIATAFELSLSGGIWTFNWFFTIDGVDFPIFSATSATLVLTNTISGCAGGSSGGFGGTATITL